MLKMRQEILSMNIFKLIINIVLFTVICLNLGSGFCCFSINSCLKSDKLSQDHDHHETTNMHVHEEDTELVQDNNLHKNCCVKAEVNDENGYIASSARIGCFEPFKTPSSLPLYFLYLNKFELLAFDSEIFPPKRSDYILYGQLLHRSTSSSQFTSTIRLLI